MIYMIHGAFSTRRTFSYIRSQLPEHQVGFFEYETKRPLHETIARLEGVLEQEKPESVIGHSLGGLMAALMVARGLVKHGASITGPLAGFDFCNLIPFGMAWAMRSTAPIFTEIRRHSYDESFLALSSTKDGLVPLESQRAAPGAKIATVAASHTEVLLCEDVVRHLHAHLFSEGSFNSSCPN